MKTEPLQNQHTTDFFFPKECTAFIIIHLLLHFFRFFPEKDNLNRSQTQPFADLSASKNLGATGGSTLRAPLHPQSQLGKTKNVLSEVNNAPMAQSLYEDDFDISKSKGPEDRPKPKRNFEDNVPMDLGPLVFEILRVKYKSKHPIFE